MFEDTRGDHHSSRRRAFETLVEGGLVAGVVSAVVTVGLLALGGVAAGVGPVVPFYAIVAIVDPGALELARSELDQDVAVTFLQQQFVGGVGICLILGAISGMIFAIGMRRHRVAGPARYAAGAIHGVLMMCLFYLGAMRAVGLLLGIEADVMSLSRLLGWPMLVLAHAVHGVVIAWVLSTRLASTENVFARASTRD